MGRKLKDETSLPLHDLYEKNIQITAKTVKAVMLLFAAKVQIAVIEPYIIRYAISMQIRSIVSREIVFFFLSMLMSFLLMSFKLLLHRCKSSAERKLDLYDLNIFSDNTESTTAFDRFESNHVST